MRGCTCASWKLMRSPARGSARSASGTPVALLQRAEALGARGGRWWCPRAPGSPRTRARTRSSEGRPSATPPRTRAVAARAARATSSSATQLDALHLRAELLDQRPERRPLRGHARVVALDHDQLRHRPARARARTRRRASRAPRRTAARSRRACRAASGAATGRGARPGASRPARRSARATRLNVVPVGLVLPRRRHRLVERVHERVQVGGGEVVLLVPGGRRQHDVREERVARHPEVDRREQVELALGRLLAPDDVARAQLGRRLLGAHRVLGGAEQVLEEVLVPLARGAEQVRAPDRHHLRVVAGRVGVLAGEAQPARRAARSTTWSAGLHAGAPRPRRRGRACCGRSSGTTAASRAARRARSRRRCACRRAARARAARRGRSGRMRS